MMSDEKPKLGPTLSTMYVEELKAGLVREISMRLIEDVRVQCATKTNGTQPSEFDTLMRF